MSLSSVLPAPSQKTFDRDEHDRAKHAKAAAASGTVVIMGSGLRRRMGDARWGGSAFSTLITPGRCAWKCSQSKGPVSYLEQ